MIHIFFVPGMFGSMLELALRAFTDIDGTQWPAINSDGSCRSLQKKFVHDRSSYRLDFDQDTLITTPKYPYGNFHLEDILSAYSTYPQYISHKKILVHAADQDWAEINMLFQYYKISIGHGTSLRVFGGEINVENIKRWNRDYTHWSQMQVWEYREWLSVFYPAWIQEWIVSPQLVDSDFLIISNQEILNNTEQTLNKIIQHCGLKQIKSFHDFAQEYRQKQQYVLDEYDLTQRIINSTLTDKSLSWSKLSIVTESILQNKFREQGFEWRCHGLNILPTNACDLSKLIYPINERILYA